jgi:hypothetical protein
MAIQYPHVHTLRTIFSLVEHLILRCDGHLIPSEWNNEADPTQWRERFRAFGNLKVIYMDYGLVGQLSRFLQPDEGESPTDLLPELRELWYSTTDDRMTLSSSNLSTPARMQVTLSPYFKA